jgi:hypothetical protein
MERVQQSCIVRNLNSALQMAAKVVLVVIPGEARDLLFWNYGEKSGFLGHTPPSE